MGISSAPGKRENTFAFHRRLIYFFCIMKTRWIHHASAPELPVVGRTVIAAFWPGRYYLVLTTQVDSSTPLRVFMRSMALQVPVENVRHERDTFMTHIFSCNKQGMYKAAEKPLYEKQHHSFFEALTGHRTTVDSLLEGRIQLE